MNKKGISKIFSIITKILSYICLIVLFFVAIFLIYYICINQIAKSKGTNPSISIFTIISPSMEPNILVYDVIIDTKIENESNLKIGDIITFYSESIDTGGYTITHRIHDIYESNGKLHYITKGDNNQVPDEGSIVYEDMVGRVKYIIPGLGKIQLFLSSKVGWVVVILIPALGLVILDLSKLISVIRIKKEIEEIPEMADIERIREKNQDKKARKAIERANRLNKGK